MTDRHEHTAARLTIGKQCSRQLAIRDSSPAAESAAQTGARISTSMPVTKSGWHLFGMKGSEVRKQHEDVLGKNQG